MSRPPSIDVVRSLHVTTLHAVPGWPVVERISHQRACAPSYDGYVRDQHRLSATVQVTMSGAGEIDGVEARVGSALILDGGAHPSLRYRALDRWEFFYVNLVGARPQIESLAAARGHVLPFPHRHPLIRHWLARLPAVGDAHATLGFHESHRVAAELLGLLTLVPPPDSNLVERALAAMADGWDRNLGLAEVARSLGVSAEHLSRAFHRVVGETASAWYRRYRIERARDLLRRGDGTVADIAARCGFSSAAYFIASFRAATGTTPARWRTEVRRPRGGSVDTARRALGGRTTR